MDDCWHRSCRDARSDHTARRGRAIVLLLAAFGMIMALHGQAGAAPRERCQGYANEATSQQNINRQQSCGFAGDPWSDNWNGHFNWCLGVSEETLRGQSGARQNALNYCGFCVNYAAEATGAQQQNVNNQCGYAGDPWSFHRDNHFRWCMSVASASADQATNFRRAEIAKCIGCRSFAARAVDAFNTTRVCGYQGDRWSPDAGAHFRWCTAVPASTSQSEDAARMGEAAKCASCGGYAREAVQAQVQNIQRQCGFGGDAWSMDEANHLRWCAGARPEAIQAASRGRQGALSTCGECQPYVNEALRAQAENERADCDLRGDRWSSDRGHHAAWCAVVDQGRERAETEARRLLLVQCLIPGRKQACEAYASTAVAQHEENGALGCRFTGDPWSSHRQNHYAWCLGISAGVSDNATKQRERDLVGCRQAMGRQPPQQCTLSVVMRTEACANADGTPSESLLPGSTSAIGCGANEQTAENAAKASLASQVALSEGDNPAPGSCTYAREAAFAGCLCDR